MFTGLTPILADVYSQPVELADFYVSNIKDRKFTAALVKHLSITAPLGPFLHLKRVRGDNSKDGQLQILLFPSDHFRKICAGNGNSAGESNQRHVTMPPLLESSNMIPSLLELSDIPTTSLSTPYLVKVPKCPPATRAQYQESSVYWPVTFHEDKRIAQMLSGTIFSDEEIQRFKTYLLEAESLGRQAAEKGQEPIGIVIVDPDSNTVVARGHDQRKGSNPLLHAVMVGVDLVARSQGGGMWSLPDPEMYFKPAKEKSDSCEMSSGDSSAGQVPKKRSGPYLCTGCDIFLSKEPCPMCVEACNYARTRLEFKQQNLLYL